MEGLRDLVSALIRGRARVTTIWVIGVTNLLTEYPWVNCTGLIRF